MPKIDYKNKKGDNVPSVTTILQVINKPALLYWAWDLGIKGIDFRKARTKEADCGTIVHAMVENHLKGQPFHFPEYPDELVKRAENSFVSFLEWFEANKFELILSEQGLISEFYQYGGTIDIFAKYKNENWLIDVKTSKAVYNEMKCQISAYKNLLEENGYQVDRTAILKIDKTPDEFVPVEFIDITEHMDKAFTAFNYALGLHNTLNILEKESKCLSKKN